MNCNTSIKKKMMDSKYSDCQITYQTLDYHGEFLSHRYILSKSGYFDGIFKYTKSNNIPPTYHINLSQFTKKILFESIHILYNSHHQYVPTLELYECINFLSFEQELINKMYIDICMEIGKVLQIDPDAGFHMLKNILECHLIDQKQQKNIIARYYNILDKKYQKEISETLKIPKQEKLLNYVHNNNIPYFKTNNPTIINQHQEVIITYNDGSEDIVGKMIVDFHNNTLYHTFLIDYNFTGEMYGEIIFKVHDFMHGTNITKTNIDFLGDHDIVTYFEIPYDKNIMVSAEIYVDKLKWY